MYLFGKGNVKNKNKNELEGNNHLIRKEIKVYSERILFTLREKKISLRMHSL